MIQTASFLPVKGCGFSLLILARDHKHQRPLLPGI